MNYNPPPDASADFREELMHDVIVAEKLRVAREQQIIDATHGRLRVKRNDIPRPNPVPV